MSINKKNLYAPLPVLERGKAFVLSGDPKGKTFLYAHGNSIVVRDIANPINCYMYTEHPVHATVAKYAPSGFYIASADVSGKVRIWDTTQEEHLLKYEYQPLSGPIKDLVWSPDSKRIAVCGAGKEVFAHAFLWDSGSAVGQITGHSKMVNSIDFRSDRPFRVVTAGEDNDSGIFEGPPFKLMHLNHEHTRYCNTVRYAPDGHVYVTGGADGKLFVYDGKDGKLKHELNGGSPNAHGGQIFAVSWSADNKRIISASGDKTVKMWDVDENKLLTTFTFGDTVDDQQMSCLWQGDFLLSVSLNGYINYLDVENPSVPKRVIQGHNKTVQALAIAPSGDEFYAGSIDGRVSRIAAQTGDCQLFGKTHTNGVVSLQVEGGQLISASLDDSIAFSGASDADLSAAKVKFPSAPRATSTAGGVTVAACVSHVVVLRNNQIASALDVKFEPSSVAVNPKGTIAAVGDKGNKIHIYSINGKDLKEDKVVEASGSVEALEFSPDGNFLASGDSSRNVFVFDTAAYEKKKDSWKFHSAKVTCLAWSPNSQYIVSGSLDTSLIIWNMAQDTKRITKKNAHPLACINSVRWVSDSIIASAAADSSIRTWDITF